MDATIGSVALATGPFRLEHYDRGIIGLRKRWKSGAALANGSAGDLDSSGLANLSDQLSRCGPLINPGVPNEVEHFFGIEVGF